MGRRRRNHRRQRFHLDAGLALHRRRQSGCSLKIQSTDTLQAESQAAQASGSTTIAASTEDADLLDANGNPIANDPIMFTPIPTYICPSEQNNQGKYNAGPPVTPNSWPTNYGVNLGTWLVYDPTGTTRRKVRSRSTANMAPGFLPTD